MINLIMAIVTSSLISILMRVSEKQVKNTLAMFFSNYLICTILSKVYIRDVSVFSIQQGSSLAIGLGVVGGIFFLLSFYLLRFNIQKNGVVLSATFMKLGVLVPTLMAVVFFHEVPKAVQVIGFLLALGAIVIINGGKEESSAKKQGLLLIILFLSGGFTDSLANIYDKTGVAELKNQYLFFIFVTATLLCVIILLFQKYRPTMPELLWGAVIGIPNYYSTRFLLLALGDFPAILVYPVYNIAVIMVVSIVGIMAFKEKLDRRKSLGMGLILAAIILLNL